MEYARHLLNKDRLRLDQKRKETVADLYYYDELERYLNPADRKKKVDRLQDKAEYLKKAIEEIDFLIDLMDRAGIDEIFKKHRREEVLPYEPKVSG